MLILATGVSGLNFQKKLGFAIPEIFNTVSCTFNGKPAQIDENIPADYIYRLHSQISLDGMLWVNRANSFFNIGFVSKENPKDMGVKFLRILTNYKEIQSYFINLNPQISKLKTKNFTYGKSCKHSIDSMVKDRIILIGDASGLMYGMYFEGIITALASAKIASEVLHDLKKNGSDYSTTKLKDYEKQLRSRILNSYIKMGDTAEKMFFHAGEKPAFTIWEIYLKLIKKSKILRKNIHTAWVLQDLEHYPEKNDIWCGQQIFKNLPVSKEISLAPFFLKLKFK